MGAGLRLIFLLAILWQRLNVRQQQREVPQRVELGCRHVPTCTVSPVGYFTYTPHPQGAAFRRKKYAGSGSQLITSPQLHIR